jgi:hypothetical protein
MNKFLTPFYLFFSSRTLLSKNGFTALEAARMDRESPVAMAIAEMLQEADERLQKAKATLRNAAYASDGDEDDEAASSDGEEDGDDEAGSSGGDGVEFTP